MNAVKFTVGLSLVLMPFAMVTGIIILYGGMVEALALWACAAAVVGMIWGGIYILSTIKQQSGRANITLTRRFLP